MEEQLGFPPLDSDAMTLPFGRMSSAEIVAQLENQLDLDSLVMVTDMENGPESVGFPGGSFLEHADRELHPSELRIRVAKHTIHREDNKGTDQHVFVVSKDRWFTLELHLTDQEGRLAVQNTLGVRAHVIFENGHEVPVAEHEPRLLGADSQTFINGTATFKLRMGNSILSQRHNEQKFRIRVEPMDPAVKETYSVLTIHSAAMRSVTKLHRRKASDVRAAAAGEAADSSGGGEAALTNSALQRQLEEERVERAQLEVRVQNLNNEFEAEKARREALEKQVSEQGQMMERLMNMNFLSADSSSAPGGRPAAGAMGPPRAPGVPRMTPTPPQAVRSRSPRHQQRDEEESKLERAQRDVADR
ncbi:hypothetical protein AB1Y20_002905 [Prymnesium parvum]|uniref:Uncharacterized protein n=1 Tax=Prymnesium parvum TaxID=97485 RepID=A0AB34JCZ1_PRYPA|mmetsp:Transcript_17912/g.44967  ORF Transcript_17912/g.44967 Transcript_17912/m.44967 type:complete len:360 (+) Transcript_17912:102-1181(+)